MVNGKLIQLRGPTSKLEGKRKREKGKITMRTKNSKQQKWILIIWGNTERRRAESPMVPPAQGRATKGSGTLGSHRVQKEFGL